MTASTSTEPAVVFVVDEDRSAREQLGRMIRQAGWRPQLFASGQAFLAQSPVDGPGCLVLGLSLPDLDGLDVQKITAADHPHMPVIFMTAHDDVPMTVRAMKAGAFDFLTKPCGSEILLRSIQRAIDCSQEALINAQKTQELHHRYASLTLREREVIALVAAGMSNKQAAEKLGISVITVKAHRAVAMRKMQADSLADLVRMTAKLSPA